MSGPSPREMFHRVSSSRMTALMIDGLEVVISSPFTCKNAEVFHAEEGAGCADTEGQ